MQNVWEANLFHETYDVNTTPVRQGTNGLRVQTFCHSTTRRGWKNDSSSQRNNIIAFLILSGNQQMILKKGSISKVSAGFFSIINLNSIDKDFLTVSDTVERYFILLEINSMTLNLLNEMFPAGLPSFQSAEQEKLQKCFENIRKNIIAADADDSLISSCAYQLLHEAMSQLPTSPLPDTLLAALNYIDNHFQEINISREDVAKAACVSISTLGNLFRKHLKTTVHDTIVQKRMEKVRQLLRFSNKPIAEIAAECGFSYSYYLTREFQKKFNLTPFQYRKQNRLQR